MSLVYKCIQLNERINLLSEILEVIRLSCTPFGEMWVKYSHLLCDIHLSYIPLFINMFFVSMAPDLA